MAYIVETWVNHHPFACYFGPRGWGFETAKKKAVQLCKNYAERAIVIDGSGYQGIKYMAYQSIDGPVKHFELSKL